MELSRSDFLVGRVAKEKMRKGILKLKVVILFLGLYCVAHASVVYLRTFTFNDERTFNDWKKMILNGEVEYRLIKHGKEGYIYALSKKACSALYYRVKYKLKDYPTLTWNWRALQFPDLSKAKTPRERDDYAARVYVIFPFLSFSSSRFLEYVWAENIPAGTIMDSPLASNTKIIVARSGKMNKQGWATETRSVYKDYTKAFGKEPNKAVGAIAIMCDADSTKTLASSLFGDIVVRN